MSSYEKLEDASKKASLNGAQHFVATMKDGKLMLSGSENFVVSLAGDDELCARLQTLMLENVVETNGELPHATNKIPDYPLLPFSPFSSQWSQLGSGDIRKILRDMLNEVGFKARGRKKTLGVGPAPLGWPHNIDWKKFTGTTRSQLSSTEITGIIVSMLTSVGKDPSTHIVTGQEVVQDINVENIDVVNQTDDEDNTAMEEEVEIYDNKRGERTVGS